MIQRQPVPRPPVPNKPLTGVFIGLIEDERAAANVYTKWLENSGAKIKWFNTVDSFRQQLECSKGWIANPESAPRLLLTDLVLPDGDGLQVVELWRKFFPSSPVLLCTAFATVENAVKSLKMGAFDFLRKPLQEESLIVAMEKAWSHACLLEENKTLSSALHVLEMAQVLAGINDKFILLKTLGRIVCRETSAAECYVYHYTGNKKQLESLLDIRSVGLPRAMPEEIARIHLGQFADNLPSPAANISNSEMRKHLPHEVLASPEKISLIFKLPSPTGNVGIVVLLGGDLAKAFKTPDLLENNKKNTELSASKQAANVQAPHPFLTVEASRVLEPLLTQGARTFQNIDVSAALSFVDELTGLYNQRFLEMALENEIARSQRTNLPLCFMFVDLDKFKLVNDTFGHIVGSQMIREASQLLKQNMRDSDYLLRYGGDEFCAILPNTPLQGAEVVTERIREAFEKAFFDLRESTGIQKASRIHVTTSIGVADFPNAALDWKSLIQAADEAMYESKKNGRNRVTCYIKKRSPPSLA